jgi:hypothetical protein
VIGWRRLVATERLTRRRRRSWLRAPVLAPVLGAAAALGLAAAPAPDAHGFWLAGAAAAAAIVVMGAPFRMFWRADAGLLGRLPIEGSELYRLAAWRALDAALPLGAFLAVAALGPGGPILEIARRVVFALALGAAAAALAPAAGLLAGAMVVSAKTQALIREVAGGQTAPGSVWLSLVPAAGGLAVAWSGWVSAPWLATAAPRALAPLAAALLGSAALLLALQPLAARALAAATREIAALDAVRLAHVDRASARGLEKLWGRLVAGPARAVYEKDVALVRRRHPMFYLVTGLGIIGAWIVAFAVAPPLRAHVVVAIAAALAAYVLVVARRLALPPTEPPRLLATLPFATSAVARAKAAHVVWRALWAVGLCGAPALARADGPVPLALALAFLFVATSVAGAALVR